MPTLLPTSLRCDSKAQRRPSQRFLGLWTAVLVPFALWSGPAAGGNGPQGETPLDRSAERVQHAVDWLAADERQGRGVGTEGLTQAEHWLAERFAELKVQPAGDDGYFHSFEVPLAIEVLEPTSLRIDGEPVERDLFVPASFSSSGSVSGEVVAVGYGITAEDLSHDDYADLDVGGKIVAIRRYTPPGARFDDATVQRRFGDLRYKAFNAREHGAAGVIIVDWPEVAAGEEMSDETPLPGLKVDAKGDAGIPVIALKRSAGARLFEGDARAELKVAVRVEKAKARNVVGLLPATLPKTDPQPTILVGAHFDHLGFGGRGSLTPDVTEPHNGADDNASGTAAVLEIAAALSARPERSADVWLVAFSAEESGLLGSTALTRRPPAGLVVEELRAMINLDMVGRLEDSRVQVLGAASAEEWESVVSPICERADLSCKLGGDGYGPSDQTPFYAAGVPVLHWFTGTHEDYHKVSDDSEKVNSRGVARIADAVTQVVISLAGRETDLTYVRTEAPVSGGDTRSFGASLGTIPDYAGDDRAGVLLAGARPGTPADLAGVIKGDLLVGLGGREIRNIYDFVYVLRSAKPGETTTMAIMRGDQPLELEVTYGKSSR